MTLWQFITQKSDLTLWQTITQTPAGRCAFAFTVFYFVWTVRQIIKDRMRNDREN